MPRRVIILGSTGSIGTQTLDVIAHLNAAAAAAAHNAEPPFQVVALAAGRNTALLAQQARQFNVPAIATADPSLAHILRDAAPTILSGPDAAEQLVRTIDADLVVAAMVGASGLPATLAAVQLGRDVALANKETLVAAGSLIVPAARASGARLLPVDSEHSALWQCLLGHADQAFAVPPMHAPTGVARVILTASGGALRSRSRDEAYHATPAQALAHPTWSMGAKVTLDSASLTNKAFEVIEAHWLFGLPADQIDVLIHPQSIVHSLIEYADGSVIAQLGSPDMRAPIQFALTYPHRPPGRAAKLDFSALSRLDFQPPDHRRFPALALAYRVINEGGNRGAVFNAASEEAALAFLASHEPAPALAGTSAGHSHSAAPLRPAAPMPFGRIVDLAQQALDSIPNAPARTLSDVLAADQAARSFVRAALA
jgi:1-deoxy-D-xylulose-5-phosphate reductoisomerase